MTSIFDNSSNTNEPTPSSVFDQLVGEGKKFSDVEALARGKQESDAFIESLKKELSELRTEVKTRLSLEEFLAKTQQQQNNNPPISSGMTPQSNEQGVDQRNAAQVSSISRDEVSNLVRDALAMEQSKATRAANLNRSREELKELFGDDYSSHLAKRVNELRLDPKFVDEIASRSPDALMALIGTKTSKTNDRFNAPPSATRNTTTGAFSSSPSNGTRNHAYWDEMRKSNLKEYMKPENQVQRHKDAQALGDKYFS